MSIRCVHRERLFLDIDRAGEGRVHARVTRGMKKKERERAREGWGKKKRSIDRAFLCDVRRARARERETRGRRTRGEDEKETTKKRKKKDKNKDESLSRGMDLDDEDEARLDAMQGDRDAIPSGAATTTLRTMTMTMTRAETTIPTVTRGEEAKKASETMTTRAMTWMERSKASSSLDPWRRGWVWAPTARFLLETLRDRERGLDGAVRRSRDGCSSEVRAKGWE